MILVGDREWLDIRGLVSISSGISSSTHLGWVTHMSHVDDNCSCDVNVSLILNSRDSDIYDSCKILTRTDVGSSGTDEPIIVEIRSRERNRVCVCVT